MTEPTARQLQILGFIETHISEVGYPPTRTDIARHFQFRSANAAEDHLRALERKGCIEIVPGVARGIKLIRRVAVGKLTANWR